MTKKVIAGLSASIAIVLHGAQLTDSGERRDGGSTLIVGEDISATRALDLLAAHQISNSEEQAEAGFDLEAALKTAAAAEKTSAAVRDAIDNGILKTEHEAVTQGGARLLAAGQKLVTDTEDMLVP